MTLLAASALGRALVRVPVPYDLVRVFGYIGFAITLYTANQQLIAATGWHAMMTGTVFLAIYLGFAFWFNREALQRSRTS